MQVRIRSDSFARFHEFLLDMRTGELRHGSDDVIRLSEQSFHILAMLLENPGEVVSREEIRRRLWPNGTVVEFEHSISAAMNRLRQALGDSAANPTYIETLAKLGYRWRNSVEWVPRSNGSVHSEEVVDPPKTHRVVPRRAWAKISITIGSIGLLLALALAGVRFVRSERSRHSSSSYPSFVRASKPVITVPGEVISPALSPDAERIAFIWRRETQPRDELYVQLIGTEQPLRVSHNRSGFICCAAWSRDGQQIAYGRCDDSGGAVFVVPATGGVERKIADVTCSLIEAGWPQWTADGVSLLLSDQCTSKGARSIVLLSVATGERRCLTSPPSGADVGDFAPSLSPDQKTVAFYRAMTIGQNEVYTVDISGTSTRQLTHGGSAIAGPLVWTPDGKHVVFNSAQIRGPSRVSAEGGPIEQALAFPAVGSLSRDGRRLAYVEGHGSYITTRVEFASPGGRVLEVKKFGLSSYGEDSPQLSVDGEHVLVRSARDSGRGEIWKANINAEEAVRLTRTDRGWVGSPHWSPDGKWIVMDYRIEDHSQIWMVDSTGGNFHAVVADEYENFVPRWSRDGRSIYFTSNRSGDWQLWRLDLVSGQKTRVTDHGGISGEESHDGLTLYYAKRESGGLWKRPLSGGPEVRVTDALHLGYWGAFAVTDNGIYFLDSDAAPRPTIDYYDIRTGRSKPVFSLQWMALPNNPSLAASPDGRRILLSQRDWKTHINLAEASQ